MADRYGQQADAPTWPSIPPLDSPTPVERVKDRVPDLVARALQAAALEIVTVPGPDGWHTDEGTRFGIIEIAPECIGGIQTATLTPPGRLSVGGGPELDECSPADYAWLVAVTWDPAKVSVQLVIEETERLRRLLCHRASLRLKGTYSARLGITSAPNTEPGTGDTVTFRVEPVGTR